MVEGIVVVEVVAVDGSAEVDGWVVCLSVVAGVTAEEVVTVVSGVVVVLASPKAAKMLPT